MWIFVNFWIKFRQKYYFSFLVIIEIPFVIRNETEGIKIKVVNPHQAKKYLTIKFIYIFLIISCYLNCCNDA